MKTKCLVAVLFLISACQKEKLISFDTTNTHTSVYSDGGYYSEAATTDSIIFLRQEVGISDRFAVHNGFGVCFVDFYNLPQDTGIYFKRAVFLFRKTNGCILTKAKVNIDGIRVKTIDISNAKNGDSLVFNLVAPHRLDPVNVDKRKHSIALLIEGDGAKDQWAQVQLKTTIFLRKYPIPQIQIPVSGLPEVSPKYVYP